MAFSIQYHVSDEADHAEVITKRLIAQLVRSVRFLVGNLVADPRLLNNNVDVWLSFREYNEEADLLEYLQAAVAGARPGSIRIFVVFNSMREEKEEVFDSYLVITRDSIRNPGWPELVRAINGHLRSRSVSLTTRAPTQLGQLSNTCIKFWFSPAITQEDKENFLVRLLTTQRTYPPPEWVRAARQRVAAAPEVYTDVSSTIEPDTGAGSTIRRGRASRLTLDWSLNSREPLLQSDMPTPFFLFVFVAGSESDPLPDELAAVVRSFSGQKQVGNVVTESAEYVRLLIQNNFRPYERRIATNPAGTELLYRYSKDTSPLSMLMTLTPTLLDLGADRGVNDWTFAQARQATPVPPAAAAAGFEWDLPDAPFDAPQDTPATTTTTTTSSPVDITSAARNALESPPEPTIPVRASARSGTVPASAGPTIPISEPVAPPTATTGASPPTARASAPRAAAAGGIPAATTTTTTSSAAPAAAPPAFSFGSPPGAGTAPVPIFTPAAAPAYTFGTTPAFPIGTGAMPALGRVSTPAEMRTHISFRMGAWHQGQLADRILVEAYINDAFLQRA